MNVSQEGIEEIKKDPESPNKSWGRSEMYIPLNLDEGELLICNQCGNWEKTQAWINIVELKERKKEFDEVLCRRCYGKRKEATNVK